MGGGVHAAFDIALDLKMKFIILPLLDGPFALEIHMGTFYLYADKQIDKGIDIVGFPFSTLIRNNRDIKKKKLTNLPLVSEYALWSVALA